MANGFQGPPAVDFYSQLSGLGDVIAKNRDAQAKRDAFAQATMPGADGKIDYGRAVLGLAQVDPQAAALLAQRQNHEDTLKQQEIANKRADAAAATGERHWNADYGLRKSAEGRAAADYENTPDQYAPNPRAAEPGQPKFIDQYAAATAAAATPKPIPYETLGGTRFLIPQPGGSYTSADPRTMGTPVQSSSAVVGDAEGVQRGLYDQPAAPGQRPPVQGGPPPVSGQPVAAAADLTAVDPNTGRREAWLKSQPPDVQAYIKKIADYEIDPRTTSIKGGHREQVLSAVAQYDPTYNQNEFGSRAKAIKDFSTGPQGNIIRSFDVAIDHLDTLDKAAKAMQNGNMVLLNQIRNKWREQTGSDLPTNFNALKPLVSGEVAKAVIGSNNALADREELRAPLNAAGSPDQISGVIGGYKALMAGQLKGIRKQYEDTTGRKDFNSRVRETTRGVLLGGEGKSEPIKIDGYTIKEN